MDWLSRSEPDERDNQRDKKRKRDGGVIIKVQRCFTEEITIMRPFREGNRAEDVNEKPKKQRSGDDLNTSSILKRDDRESFSISDDQPSFPSFYNIDTTSSTVNFTMPNVPTLRQFLSGLDDGIFCDANPTQVCCLHADASKHSRVHSTRPMLTYPDHNNAVVPIDIEISNPNTIDGAFDQTGIEVSNQTTIDEQSALEPTILRVKSRDRNLPSPEMIRVNDHEVPEPEPVMSEREPNMRRVPAVHLVKKIANYIVRKIPSPETVSADVQQEEAHGDDNSVTSGESPLVATATQTDGCWKFGCDCCRLHEWPCQVVPSVMTDTTLVEIPGHTMTKDELNDFEATSGPTDGLQDDHRVPCSGLVTDCGNINNDFYADTSTILSKAKLPDKTSGCGFNQLRLGLSRKQKVKPLHAMHSTKTLRPLKENEI